MKKTKPGDIFGTKKLIRIMYVRGKMIYWLVKCLTCETEYMITEIRAKKVCPCKFCHRKKTKHLVSGYFRIRSRRPIEY